MFPTSLCFTVPLFSFFIFLSLHSLKLWRIVNIHVNISCKLLSPPVLVDSTRFSLYAITEVSRKPKHTHFKYQFQNIHFLCAIFPRSVLRTRFSVHTLWLGFIDTHMLTCARHLAFTTPLVGEFWLPWTCMFRSQRLELVDSSGCWLEMHRGSVDLRQTVWSPIFQALLAVSQFFFYNSWASFVLFIIIYLFVSSRLHLSVM